ncbi:hypothetical protein J6590_000472 [Homalodisca vitripennis]|nr:hypothetical protein J6590_000472 [Homalodisca vitripennis]
MCVGSLTTGLRHQRPLLDVPEFVTLPTTPYGRRPSSLRLLRYLFSCLLRQLVETISTLSAAVRPTSLFYDHRTNYSQPSCGPPAYSVSCAVTGVKNLPKCPLPLLLRRRHYQKLRHYHQGPASSCIGVSFRSYCGAFLRSGAISCSASFWSGIYGLGGSCPSHPLPEPSFISRLFTIGVSGKPS